MSELKVIYHTDIDMNITIYLEDDHANRSKIYPLSNEPADLLHFARSLASKYKMSFIREKAIVIDQVLEVKIPKKDEDPF